MKTANKPPFTLPLRVVYVEGSGHRVENQHGLVLTHWLFQAEAEYIARAVNCHEELVEACKSAQCLATEIVQCALKNEPPPGVGAWVEIVKKAGGILTKVKLYL
jgi:hypothetical protein